MILLLCIDGRNSTSLMLSNVSVFMKGYTRSLSENARLHFLYTIYSILTYN